MDTSGAVEANEGFERSEFLRVKQCTGRLSYKDRSKK